MVKLTESTAGGPRKGLVRLRGSSMRGRHRGPVAGSRGVGGRGQVERRSQFGAEGRGIASPESKIPNEAIFPPNPNKIRPLVPLWSEATYTGKSGSEWRLPRQPQPNQKPGVVTGVLRGCWRRTWGEKVAGSTVAIARQFQASIRVGADPGGRCASGSGDGEKKSELAVTVKGFFSFAGEKT